ncbi:MAG: hypothetical protein ACRDN9_21315 [Streptosporangiaceae bacterium]
MAQLRAQLAGQLAGQVDRRFAQRRSAESGLRTGAEQEVPTLPTLPALAELLPDPGLRRGASYAVEGSTTLALALAAGPSAEGSWCAAVGMPMLGIEAAAELGLDLDRLALVPDPGDRWLSVVATMAEAFDVVLVKPPTRAYDAQSRRLAARFRERGTVLLVLGSWPGCEARLAVTGSRWHGLGNGHGRLTAREAMVTVSGRRSAARPRTATLWLPDPVGGVRLADPGATDSGPGAADSGAGAAGETAAPSLTALAAG